MPEGVESKNLPGHLTIDYIIFPWTVALALRRALYSMNIFSTMTRKYNPIRRP